MTELIISPNIMCLKLAHSIDIGLVGWLRAMYSTGFLRRKHKIQSNPAIYIYFNLISAKSAEKNLLTASFLFYLPLAVFKNNIGTLLSSSGVPSLSIIIDSVFFFQKIVEKINNFSNLYIISNDLPS